MKLHASLLAAACALALSACGGEPSQTQDTATTPAPATTAADDAAKVEPASVPEAPMGQVPADGSMADAGDAAAGATGCAVDIEGNDMMQFNVSSISVPSSCAEFTINLTHTGRLPAAAMGHNVVITSSSDTAGVAADGISAGAAADYLKAGDSRVIAATDMIGGGESTSVTFDVAKIKTGGPYGFFCSFPGHAALMKGTISVD
ncbi:azurin [Luteimonas terricola]|uniref:Blue (type 1) copper domain-containing protein n=1 Tax=Luteimonas terricola TaxID=645597 RepID=A0ABQ2EDA1_9GAMM|nr:azurin [Luteimonas terricola]GGK03934.1 hypothetical protein GCM10011394_11150 [Luteimonas terricola]